MDHGYDKGKGSNIEFEVTHMTPLEYKLNILATFSDEEFERAGEEFQLILPGVDCTRYGVDCLTIRSPAVWYESEDEFKDKVASRYYDEIMEYLETIQQSARQNIGALLDNMWVINFMNYISEEMLEQILFESMQQGDIKDIADVNLNIAARPTTVQRVIGKYLLTIAGTKSLIEGRKELFINELKKYDISYGGMVIGAYEENPLTQGKQIKKIKQVMNIRIPLYGRIKRGIPMSKDEPRQMLTIDDFRPYEELLYQTYIKYKEIQHG